jgi:hypothetical protein
VPEAALTGLPINKIKETISQGQVPAARGGSRYVIRTDDLIDFVVKVTGKTAVRVRYDLDHY